MAMTLRYAQASDNQSADELAISVALYAIYAAASTRQASSRPGSQNVGKIECCVSEHGAGSEASTEENRTQDQKLCATDLEVERAHRSWASYREFLAVPGHKCPKCWLMRQHCCCIGMFRLSVRPRVLVLVHHLELGKHLGSNTAKLLFNFGGELFAWGIPEHDARLQSILDRESARTVVLFPSPGAKPASELASGCDESGNHQGSNQIILVLDGGWRECKRMNEWIDPRIQRCVVTTADREEYGGTRKYSRGSDGGRVQTAAAFIALMQELGHDPVEVSALKAGLAHFMNCWESQIRRSKTWVS